MELNRLIKALNIAFELPNYLLCRNPDPSLGDKTVSQWCKEMDAHTGVLNGFIFEMYRIEDCGNSHLNQRNRIHLSQHKEFKEGGFIHSDEKDWSEVIGMLKYGQVGDKLKPSRIITQYSKDI